MSAIIRILRQRMLRVRMGEGSPIPPICNPLSSLQDQNDDFILDENGNCIQE